MKKIILFATAIMMAGCGFMQSSTSSNNSQPAQPATTTAQASNAAIDRKSVV